MVTALIRTEKWNNFSKKNLSKRKIGWQPQVAVKVNKKWKPTTKKEDLDASTRTILKLLKPKYHLLFIKFIFFEKATKFCKISTLLLSYLVTVKSKVKISQNFVAFSEYMNFNSDLRHESLKPKSDLTDFILLFGGKNVLLILGGCCNWAFQAFFLCKSREDSDSQLIFWWVRN